MRNTTIAIDRKRSNQITRERIFSRSASFPSPKYANTCTNYQDNDSVINANNAHQLCDLELEEETMDVSLDNNSEHSGWKITSIDLDRQWTKTIVNFMKKCKH